ncbi:MAG: PQQ-binding-like beta-propeller repeat protein, partial [Candidatus Baltobacteraceae bacterium]
DDAANNAVVALSGPAVSWKRKLGGKVNGGLAYADGTVYVDSFDRHLYALNARTGAVVWKAPLDGIAMNTPVLANGVVVVGTGTNRVLIDTPNQVLWGRPGGDNVLAFNAMDGVPIWRYHTIGEDMPSAVIIMRGKRDPEVVFSNGDGFVRSLDLLSGKKIWRSYLNGVATMSSLESYHGTLFGIENFSVSFIFANINNPTRLQFATKAWAMNAKNGQLIWTIPYGSSDSSPSASNGRLFFQTSKLVYPITTGNTLSYSVVYAVDIATGSVLWEKRSGNGYRSVRGSNEDAIAGAVYHGTYLTGLPFSRKFAAYDVKNGRIRWEIKTNGPVKMSAVIVDGKAVFGDTHGYLYVVDCKEHRLVKKIKFPSFFTTSPPIVVGKTLYIANNKAIYALKLSDLFGKQKRFS